MFTRVWVLSKFDMRMGKGSALVIIDDGFPFNCIYILATRDGHGLLATALLGENLFSNI